MGKINYSQKSRAKKDQHFWREMIKKFTTSGLTKRQFCRQQGFAVSSFYKWLHHFAFENVSHEMQTAMPTAIPTTMFRPLVIPEIRAAARPSAQAFVPTAKEPASGSGSASLVVEFKEYRIIVSSGFGTETLCRLLEVLRGTHA